jgi:hypothetical protein
VPENEFELSIYQESSKFFETVPEFLQLTHKSTNLHFRFTIDSFDLILRSATGEIFNDHITSSIRFDLANFATMLLRSPVHKVVLMDPSGTFHNVQADGPVIELMREGSL